MKKWSTLIFIVNKYAGTQSDNFDLKRRDFLTKFDNNAMFSPSENSIKNIMDFASSYEVLESHNTGQIELITN